MNTEMPRSLSDIARAERRRLLAMLVIRTSLSVAMLLLIYALLPAERTTTTDALVRLVAALVFVALVIALQVHAIRSANHPVLRAIEAAINALFAFIIVFALFYLGATLDSARRHWTGRGGEWKGRVGTARPAG